MHPCMLLASLFANFNFKRELTESFMRYEFGIGNHSDCDSLNLLPKATMCSRQQKETVEPAVNALFI